ncbi:MAG: APC family permease [Candidatus Dormibacteria bacterium]
MSGLGPPDGALPAVPGHAGVVSPRLPGLRQDSLRFLGTVANAVGIQAPVGGVSFLPALMAGIVGAAGPLSFLAAMVAMLFVAYAFVTFTRAFNSAGSVYAFNGRSLGPAYGFISVWLLLGVYIAYAAAVYASNANALRVLATDASLRVDPGLFTWVSGHWVVLAVLLWALTIGLAYRSIRLSSTVILIAEGLALVLVALVAAAVIVHGGYRGHSLSATPFTPGGLGVATIGLGVVFAFTGFSGFEVAATLGEEASLPRRVVPAAMVGALLFSGGVYTLMAWVETVAFRSPAVLAAAADHGVPLVTVAQAYVSPAMGSLILVAALVSGFGAQLACVNGATRLLYAMGRDHLGPHGLTRVSSRHQSPVGALGVVAVLSLVAFLPLIGGDPLSAFFDLATYGADLIIVAYLLTVIAALAWSIRSGRRHPLHLVVLVAGALILGYILKSTILPIPAFPFNLLILLTAVTVLVAVLMVALLPSLRRRLARAALVTTEPS